MYLTKLIDEEFKQLLIPSNGDRTVNRYPLTNIGMDEDGVIHVELALAGFKKEYIDIDVKGNELYIKGTLPDNDEPKISYYQKHISTCDFTRVLSLTKHYVDSDVKASMSDGILSLTITPKEQYKKKIEIE